MDATVKASHYINVDIIYVATLVHNTFIEPSDMSKECRIQAEVIELWLTCDNIRLYFL